MDYKLRLLHLCSSNPVWGSGHDVPRVHTLLLSLLTKTNQTNQQTHNAYTYTNLCIATSHGNQAYYSSQIIIPVDSNENQQIKIIKLIN